MVPITSPIPLPAGKQETQVLALVLRGPGTLCHGLCQAKPIPQCSQLPGVGGWLFHRG